MKTKQLRGLLIILFASLIWGAAFVAQSVGMEKIGPFTFSAVRILIGAATLAGIILVKHGIERKKVPNSSRPFFTKRELVFGGMMGVVLSVACNFQQYSLVYTTPGKRHSSRPCISSLCRLQGCFLNIRSLRSFGAAWGLLW